MGGHQPDYSSPADLDIRDPDFRSKFLLWQNQQHCEIADLIERTKGTLAVSRALMEEADLLLALR